MKNQSIGKKLLFKIGLFSTLLLLLNGVPQSSFSQNNPPPQAAPGMPDTGKLNPKTMPPEFTTPEDKTRVNQKPADSTQLKTKKNTTSKKLTPAQIKKIVGNDKVLGKDPQGHQLYEDSKGETYYLLDNGTKVILK